MGTIVQNIGSLVHHCSKTKAFKNGLSLHTTLFKMGLQSNTILSNHLLNMYAKCNNLGLARQVFDEMPERNLVAWSAMISGYDQAGKPSMALDLFSLMNFQPNEYIYASVLSACASLSDLAQGKRVHAQSIKSGYVSISFVSNSLVSMYMGCGLCDDAVLVFGCTSELNCVSYNAMISGFAENGDVEKSLEMFRVMCRRGVVPDRFTFVGVFGICSIREDLKSGVELHCQTIKFGLNATRFVGNLILTMYSKCNSIVEAGKVFKSIEEKDAISWNTLIAACSHWSDYGKALRAFREMGKAVDVRPDDFTYTAALAACARLASIRHGRPIHAHVIRTRVHLDAGVGNALVNMYAKCGCIGYASSVFHRMPDRNLVTWNTIIAGYGNHGHGKSAVEMFEQMKATGIKPDSVTFIGLLTACNHAGMVDEGRAYFDSMNEIYGIAPEIEHFSCLIDLLGRIGRLAEAEGYSKSLRFGDDLVVLGSMLSACRLHGDVVVGERLAQRILELQPETSSPYVLLSNLYASDGRWDGVAESRKMLKGSGVKKEPGHSLIEVKGMVEKFTVGDFSHLMIEKIREVLRGLSWAVRELTL